MTADELRTQLQDNTLGEVADADSKKVVDEIAAAKTDMRDRPLEDVVIESVSIEK